MNGNSVQPIGFIGLGVMGTPMAMNLARAGTSLVVWNRTAEKCAPLEALGARRVNGVQEVFRETSVVILMLANERAIDAVLQRGSDGFSPLAREQTIVNMGTTSPAYSQRLGDDIAAAGGHYVEAPVSGSRQPAEAGQLIGLLAGATADVERI